MGKRIHWIDIAKGIGIIFVVLGHCQISQKLLHVITYFHMPLFFFLAGYVFRPGEQTFSEFFKKRVRSILVPYAFFLLLSILASMCRNLIGQEITIQETFDGLLSAGSVESNRPLWFLRSIFAVEMLFFLLCLILHTFSVKKMAALIYAGFGVVFAMNWSFYTRTINGLLFYAIGYAAKQMNLADVLTKRKGLLCIASGIGFAATSWYMIHNQYSFSITTRDNLLPFLLVTHIGILFVVMLSLCISKNWILEFLGRHSLVILGTHILVKDIISVGLKLVLNNNTFIDTVSNGNAVLTTVLILIGCSFLAVAAERWCPMLIGKGKPWKSHSTLKRF